MKFLNEILNIAILLLFGLLMMGIFSGFANAEPYQIPDRNWDNAQNCNGRKYAGKHYMMVTSKATGKLITFCMKTPVKLPNSSWDHAIAMALVRIANTNHTLPEIVYLDVVEIWTTDQQILVTLSDALTGKEYKTILVYP